MEEITFKQGGTWTTVFRWERYEVPIDLTGCSAALQVRPRKGGAAALDLSDAGGELVIDEAGGTVTLTVAAAATAQVAPGEYLADMKVTFPDATVVPTETFGVEVIEAQTQ